MNINKTYDKHFSKPQARCVFNSGHCFVFEALQKLAVCAMQWRFMLFTFLHLTEIRSHFLSSSSQRNKVEPEKKCYFDRKLKLTFLGQHLLSLLKKSKFCGFLTEFFWSSRWPSLDWQFLTQRRKFI